MNKDRRIEGWLHGDVDMLTAFSNVMQSSEDTLWVRTSQIYKDKDLINGKMKVEAVLKAAKTFRNVQKEPLSKPVHGFVYVFRCSSTIIKIGASESPLNRQRQFKSNLPFEAIHIIHTIETDDVYGLETALQNKYSKWRYNNTREYFKLPDEQLEELLATRGM